MNYQIKKKQLNSMILQLKTLQQELLTVMFALMFAFLPSILPLMNLALILILIIFLFNYKEFLNTKVINNSPVIWIFLLLYINVLIGITYTDSTWVWIELHLGKYAKFIYASILILILIKHRRLQAIALKAFVLGMFFVLISTWLNIWFLLPWSRSQVIGWGQNHYVYGDHITQNIIMAFFSVLSIHLIRESANRYRKIFWLICSIFSILSITHLSQGRTGALVLFAGLSSYLFFTYGFKKFIPLGGLLVIFSLLLISTSTQLDNRIHQAKLELNTFEKNEKTSIGHRIFNATTTIELIKARPIFGHGTGGYHTAICDFIKIKSDTKCDFYNWHPHNQYLFFAADHGLIGFLTYLGLIFALYLTAVRSPNKNGKLLLSTLATILAVDSLFNSPFYSSRESEFFAYMIALLVSMCYVSDKEHWI